LLCACCLAEHWARLLKALGERQAVEVVTVNSGDEGGQTEPQMAAAPQKGEDGVGILGGGTSQQQLARQAQKADAALLAQAERMVGEHTVRRKWHWIYY